MKPITRIEQSLAQAISTGEAPGCPPKLAAAICHAVFPGGARIRPKLCLAVANACGDDDPTLSDAAAVAIELLHCASLVHDDLPCFDDAPTRRGRASVHWAFGEPLAVLAGDALIVLAWPQAQAMLDALKRGDAQVVSSLDLGRTHSTLSLANGMVHLADGSHLDAEELQAVVDEPNSCLRVAADGLQSRQDARRDGPGAKWLRSLRAFGLGRFQSGLIPTDKGGSHLALPAAHRALPAVMRPIPRPSRAPARASDDVLRGRRA